MLFKGYSPLILTGTLQTITLALLSLIVSIFIGLAGALAKLSTRPLLRYPAMFYTTLIRGVPDLVLMLLLFYSFQIGLNQFTDWLEINPIDLDPFITGILTLGFIYGAYFTETFRGAFLSAPRGQIDAGFAYGMSSFQVFRRILFAHIMRSALPGIANNWQVLIKATALVSIIGLYDLVKAAQEAGRAALNSFAFMALAALIYLILTTLSNFALIWLERRYVLDRRQPQPQRAQL